MDVRPDPPPPSRPRLGRIETLALASGLFVFSSIVVCQQEVVTDPVEAASTLVRLRSPWAEGHEAGRPVLHCSLNGVDVQPPSAVWVVGNRGLVLHSRNDGHTWTRVTLGSAAPPPYVARGASARPGRGGSMRLAVAYEKAPPSPSAAPPKTPPTLPPEPQAQVQDTSPAGPEDLVGVHFSRDGKTRRGWIVSRSGRVHVTEDDGATWVESGRVGGRAYAAGFGGGGFELIDSEGGRALLAPLFGASLVGDTLWIAGEDGRVVRRRRPFEGDDLRLATGGEPLLAAFFRDEDNGWAVGRRGRIVAVDARQRRFEPQATPTLADLHAVSFMPGGRRGWAVGAQGTILDTQDGGEHWRASSVPATEEPRPWSPRLPYWYALASLAAFGLLVRATRLREEGTSEDASIADAPGSDRPVESPAEDVLDFQSVARGLSRFLRNEKTTPPLTLAVIGEWGTGKSSLMNLLRADLQQFGFRPVWFNAWHHQKEEHLLAALLQTLRLQGIPPWWTPAGWEFRVRLMAIRGWRNWAVVGLVLAAFMLVAGYEMAHHSLLALVTVDGKELAELGKGMLAGLTDLGDHRSLGVFLASSLSVIFTVVKLLKPFGVNPASLLASVSGTSRLGALDAQTSFRHQFAAEFRDVSRALGPRTMPIFIDDLDRCRPAQVVDTLEAISFLVSSGDCFVVLGMARDKVERCVGLSFRELAEEMAGENARPADAHHQREAFARQYLDKLINIEVPIQEPTIGQARDLLVTEAPARPRTGVSLLRSLWPAIPLCLLLVAAFALGRRLPALQAERAVATPRTMASLVSPRPAPKAPPSRGDEPAVLPARDLGSFPPVGGDDERPDVESPPARPWFLAYAIVWPLGLAVILVCAWVLSRRRDLVVRDSPEFRRALETWHEVIVAPRPTPRALKRFVNRLRYLAMRQRPYPPAPPLWRAVVDRLQGRPGPTLPPSLDRIPESALVALSALEHYDPALVQGPIDSSVTLPGAVATALVAGERTAAGSQDALERHRHAYLRMAGRVEVR